ncbi:2-oxoacid:acceptor oxidoreductase family protein [Magnetococcus sp. PR-3]|uniref:2-oxoacid:acceptor oxidoreductase family protein n=1 Tax=Magnetococcus sp. PR-3 TaxID=3120355 RepID=UPI002FCE144F
MFQIRIHGRGGQGVVTGAELLSVAAFQEGKHAQAFPSFGSERMGAPVISYCRIDTRTIRLREPINEPDAILIQDPTLLQTVPVFAGLKKDGYLLINTARSFEELQITELIQSLDPKKVARVAATEIALEHIGRPVPNAALLAGLSAVSGAFDKSSLISAVEDKFPPKIAAGNLKAVEAAFANTQIGY